MDVHEAGEAERAAPVHVGAGPSGMGSHLGDAPVPDGDAGVVEHAVGQHGPDVPEHVVGRWPQ